MSTDTSFTVPEISGTSRCCWAATTSAGLVAVRASPPGVGLTTRTDTGLASGFGSASFFGAGSSALASGCAVAVRACVNTPPSAASSPKANSVSLAILIWVTNMVRNTPSARAVTRGETPLRPRPKRTPTTWPTTRRYRGHRSKEPSRIFPCHSFTRSISLRHVLEARDHFLIQQGAQRPDADDDGENPYQRSHPAGVHHGHRRIVEKHREEEEEKAAHHRPKPRRAERENRHDAGSNTPAARLQVLHLDRPNDREAIVTQQQDEDAHDDEASDVLGGLRHSQCVLLLLVLDVLAFLGDALDFIGRVLRALGFVIGRQELFMIDDVFAEHHGPEHDADDEDVTQTAEAADEENVVGRLNHGGLGWAAKILDRHVRGVLDSCLLLFLFRLLPLLDGPVDAAVVLLVVLNGFFRGRLGRSRFLDGGLLHFAAGCLGRAWLFLLLDKTGRGKHIAALGTFDLFAVGNRLGRLQDGFAIGAGNSG